MQGTTLTKGFTLLEVMIALVIFSIGLLGLAGMQVISMENNRVAYKRTMATMLAYDIADRIRNNPTASYAHSASTPLSAPGTSCVSTTAGVCGTAAMAAWDLYEWDQAMRDTKNTNLTNPRGWVTKDATANVYTISIGWDETAGTTPTSCSPTPAPTGVECVTIRVEL